MQKVSRKGLVEIASHEGIVLSPYLDSVGVWTVGIGHTANAGEPDPAKERREFSIAEIMDIFARDMDKFERRVRKAFSRTLTQEQFDAAVSFDFNTGGIHRATWVKRFNEGKDAEARTAFMMWRKPKEIIPRREKERDLFFDGAYANDGMVTVYPASSAGKVLWGQGKRVALPDIGGEASAIASAPEVEAERSFPANPKSPILPLYRPKQADHVTEAVLAHFSHLMPADRRLDDVKVLVVRGYFENSMGRRGVNDRAVYDDAVFVVTPDGVQPFNGNSDPSVYRKRVATIKAPQAIRYRPGLHGFSRKDGPYPAFRQDADCTVVRDGAGDDTGMFHVNFHRGGVNETSSLGCLTIPPHQWDEFRDLVNGLLEKHGQDTFFATVVEYAGGKPPVNIPEPKPSAPSPQPAKPNTAVVTVAAVATGGLVASWWDKIAAFFANLF